MTTERFFGGIDNRVPFLQRTLQYVSEEKPTESELTEWIIVHTPAASEKTVRRNIVFLDSIELIDRSKEVVRSTNKGEAFWRRNEPQVVYEGLATAVDGFPEIIRAIANGQRSIEEICDVLRKEYPDFVLPNGVVSKHLDWLITLGLATEENGVYSLPIEGGTFDVGKRYSRWFIHDVFKGERYKGIATPSNHPLIFIFTGNSGSDYGYDDEFLEDDRFLYTGAGTVGDMTMDGGNKALKDHRKNGKTIHLFEDTEMPWIVTYLGEYEYVRHKIDTLPDENGEDRKAFRFLLEPVGGTEVIIEEGTLSTISDAELFSKAKDSAPTRSVQPESTSGSGRRYDRSRVVREFALRMAEGVCQGCEEDAPFVDSKGKPFLEVHHLTRLSDGGPDDPENVIAVCPNCHRRAHQGNDRDAYNEQLRQRAEQVYSEFL